MKILPSATVAFALLVFSIYAGAQTSDRPTSRTATRICGPYGCEQVPVPGLPKTKQNPSTYEPTSTDLYCDTMVIAFMDVALDSKPPSSPEHAKRVEAAEHELLETCKATPIVGGKEKNQRDMSPQELAQISCLATADGIATAHVSKTDDRLLYSKLSQRRSFFSKACESNRKQFLSDMKKYGPYHVLSKTY